VSGRREDNNGYWEIEDNPVSKAGVYPYLGAVALRNRHRLNGRAESQYAGHDFFLLLCYVTAMRKLAEEGFRMNALQSFVSSIFSIISSLLIAFLGIAFLVGGCFAVPAIYGKL
jgi:hypothetical protein